MNDRSTSNASKTTDTAITLPAYTWKAIVNAAAEFSKDTKVIGYEPLKAIFFETTSDMLIVTTSDGHKLQSLELPYKTVDGLARMIPAEVLARVVRNAYSKYKVSELKRLKATLTFKADVAVFGLGNEELPTHVILPYTPGRFPNYREIFDGPQGDAPSNRSVWSPGHVAALCKAADILEAYVVKQTSDDSKPIRYSYTSKLYDVTITARAIIM